MDSLDKIAGTPLEKVPSRVGRWAANRLRGVAEELWARSGGLEVKPSGLPGMVSGQAVTPSNAARSVLEAMIARFAPEAGLVDLAGNLFPDEVSSLIHEADLLSMRHFHILGEDLDYSSGIRWHYDPRNGHEFPSDAFYSRIPHSRPEGGYDIKYPWELSRLQHLPRLALAFRLTQETRYLDALIDQAGDWIARNPVGFGPNWACTMDVAIRAANMGYAFALAAKPDLPPDFACDLVGSLIAHGRFIAGHLEWSEELTSNHYLADIAGLGVLASLLGGTVEEANSWLEFARDELASEMKKQVYPDGWDFEASTAYHRLALECFLIPAIFIERAGMRTDEAYRAGLKSMAAFVRDITMPDGSFPLIGDNDSGLFMALQTRDSSSLNYLLALCAAYLGEPALRRKDLGAVPEILWLLGRDGLERFEWLGAQRRPMAGAFPDGGLWCLRSEDEEDLLTFRLGPVGQNGAGGHAHNDQLSITIWFSGKPLIVDPGSAVYTSDPVRRNRYRSTESHATVAVGRDEQNRFVEGNLFTLPQTIETRFSGVETGSDRARLEGVLLGYGPWSKEDVRVTRTVTHDRQRRQFEIEDVVELSEKVGETDIVWNFPLAPGLAPLAAGTSYLKILDKDGNMVAEILYFPGWTVQFVDTMFSSEYGAEIPNTTLRFEPPPDSGRAHFIFRAAPDVPG